ncbi:prefoldin subunit [Theileria orientalis]|uniref:Prefoldin subunit n=1 Tax=Theileria orientalis TaxID=68886 RepID=A0A976MBS9_THEOR|nr:prefoldin subunit [Theileria orientalis]
MEGLVNEINSLREKHREQTVVHSKLLTQQNESMAALNEVKLVDEDAKIFRTTGPILSSQTKQEAVSTITKRLEYIKGEIDTVDRSISDLQSKIEEKCKKLEAMRERARATVPTTT